jgi:hypothetical protein
VLGEQQAEPGGDGTADRPRLHARTPRTHQQDTRLTRGQLLPRYAATCHPDPEVMVPYR